MTAVGVFCSSSSAAPSSYVALAQEAGAAVASRGWRLVYGGASIGLMGAVADGALAAGGEVEGVITGHLTGFEIAHQGLTQLHTVDSMHERKTLQLHLSDAILVLPGGFGTLDEVMEAVTWRQLGLHDKPIVLLDHEGFWQPLLTFLRHASEVRLIRPAHLTLFSVAGSVTEAMDQIAHPPSREQDPDKWWFDHVPERHATGS